LRAVSLVHYFNVSSQWYISRVKFWAHISSLMVFPSSICCHCVPYTYLPCHCSKCLNPPVPCSQLYHVPNCSMFLVVPPTISCTAVCMLIFPPSKTARELLINNQWTANGIPGFLIKLHWGDHKFSQNVNAGR
jgi:hypothetical protein